MICFPYQNRIYNHSQRNITKVIFSQFCWATRLYSVWQQTLPLPPTRNTPLWNCDLCQGAANQAIKSTDMYFK